MKIACIHCGRQFSIHAADLGGMGTCPHCHGQIALPKAASSENRPAPRGERQRPLGWLDGSISGLISLALHMSLFLAIVLWQQGGGSGGAGEGEEVLIGLLPTEDLVERPDEQLMTTEVTKQQSSDLSSLVEVDVPSPATTAAAAGSGDLAAAALSASGGDAGSFDLGPVQIGGGGSVGGGSFEGMIGALRRTGLDIVICFDSTGSMSGEINQVKQQIERIGQTLTALVPKARISICTYRDQGDEFVAKGLPLTSNIQDVSSYLARIEAGGGGDHPEAVEEGLYWSSGQNRFRPAARKVILLFGDAPPHEEKLKRCLEIARDFQQQHKGIVSTVTCRNDQPLPEFYQIAVAGGGEAFLTTDQRQIMTQLMVLVFGSQHRQKVIEAFKLLER
jgi:Mg-chelatase subunit ChlD